MRALDEVLPFVGRGPRPGWALLAEHQVLVGDQQYGRPVPFPPDLSRTSVEGSKGVGRHRVSRSLMSFTRTPTGR